MVCLRSARKVIEIGKDMMDSSNRVNAIKIWTVNHHVFVSLTILVMDYCFNRDEPRARERKDEILECFKLLEAEERRRESTIATRGLQKLKDILRDGAKRRKSPEADLETNSFPPRSFLSSTETMIFPATNSNTAASGPDVFTSANDFGQPSLESQYQWDDFDNSTLDNIDFDVDLDANQFDVLFQSIEGNKMF